MPQPLHFPPFRFDLDTERLWRGTREVALKPKTAAMLRYLATNPRRLIRKAELQEAVWGATSVSAETVRSTLRELRKALDEDPRAPAFVETVHGRGYRFVAALEGEATTAAAPPDLVGRGPALAELRGWFAEAVRGRRQVAFMVGEPGIGRTALDEAFLGLCRRDDGALCLHGQCVSGYGGSEPYRPLLKALERACRREDGRRWVEC